MIEFGTIVGETNSEIDVCKHETENNIQLIIRTTGEEERNIILSERSIEELINTLQEALDGIQEN